MWVLAVRPPVWLLALTGVPDTAQKVSPPGAIGTSSALTPNITAQAVMLVLSWALPGPLEDCNPNSIPTGPTTLGADKDGPDMKESWNY